MSFVYAESRKFNDGGFGTAGIGKSHLQPFTGIAAEQRIGRDDLALYKDHSFGE